MMSIWLFLFVIALLSNVVGMTYATVGLFTLNMQRKWWLAKTAKKWLITTNTCLAILLLIGAFLKHFL